MREIKLYYESGQVSNAKNDLFPTLTEFTNGNMPENVCLELGGHCYEYTNEMLMTNPPKSVRKCKHCGKVQTGTYQDNIRWE